MFTKKVLTSAVLAGVAILGFSSLACADQPGFYITGQVGDSDSTLGHGFDTTGIAGGLFGGYQFNPYVAAELGYVRFHNSTLSVYTPSYYWGMPYQTTATIKQQAGEAAIKGIIPLADGFSLYGKGGLAYVDSTGNVHGAGLNYNSSSHDWRPLYGAGLSYDITQNVTADVSWTRIQNNNNISSINFTALGLTYYFG